MCINIKLFKIREASASLHFTSIKWTLSPSCLHMFQCIMPKMWGMFSQVTFLTLPHLIILQTWFWTLIKLWYITIFSKVTVFHKYRLCNLYITIIIFNKFTIYVKYQFWPAIHLAGFLNGQPFFKTIVMYYTCTHVRPAKVAAKHKLQNCQIAGIIYGFIM